MTRPPETFARVPERWPRLLEQDEILFEAYGVMVYLVGRCDPATGQWVGELQALKSATRYPKTIEHLRQVLLRLRELEEIAFEVRQGQRKPWVITVLGEGWGLPPATTSKAPPREEGGGFGSALEVDLQSDADEQPGNRDDEAGSGTSRLPTAARGSGTDLDVDLDEGSHRREDPDLHASRYTSHATDEGERLTDVEMAQWLRTRELEVGNGIIEQLRPRTSVVQEAITDAQNAQQRQQRHADTQAWLATLPDTPRNGDDGLSERDFVGLLVDSLGATVTETPE